MTAPIPPDAVAQAREMARQAALGHKQFCVGFHDHGELGVEEEWVSWGDAFASLIAAVRAECAASGMGLAILDQSGNVICRNVEDGCAWEIVDALDAAFPPEAPHSLWNYTADGHWKVERNANTAEAQP